MSQTKGSESLQCDFKSWDATTALEYKKAASNLKVSALGFEPVLDVALGISGETEHEVPLDLQLVDGLDGLVDLKEKQWKKATDSNVSLWNWL